LSVVSVGLRTVLSYCQPDHSHENAYIIADVSFVVYRPAVHEGTDIQFVCPQCKVRPTSSPHVSLHTQLTFYCYGCTFYFTMFVTWAYVFAFTNIVYTYSNSLVFHCILFVPLTFYFILYKLFYFSQVGQYFGFKDHHFTYTRNDVLLRL